MRIAILILILFVYQGVFASDTLKISIKQADSIFLVNNYDLLASAMNIDVQRAQIIQAKLYPNPVITADFNAYDPQYGRVAHVGKTGEKVFQFDQLILLGGKRKSQIELAKSNAVIAEIEFQDLVRQLKFQLHSSLYFINEQAFLLSKYNQQLALLDTILLAYDVQVKKGNIPLNYLVRLKGVYLNLNNSRASVFKHYFEEMAKVQTILQINKTIDPVILDAKIYSSIKLIELNELVDIALQNRPDYLISIQNKTMAEQYYNYQRKMAIPDLNIFTSYDQRGGAFTNQLNLGVSMPLPVWNRNQGNIKSAKMDVKQKEYSAESLKNNLLFEVQNYYSFYNQTIIEYRKTSQLYNQDFETTLIGMSDNFQRGNVSLIEFVDFFESYNNALAEIARIKIQIAFSEEQLNLSIGKEIF